MPEVRLQRGPASYLSKIEIEWKLTGVQVRSRWAGKRATKSWAGSKLSGDSGVLCKDAKKRFKMVTEKMRSRPGE